MATRNHGNRLPKLGRKVTLSLLWAVTLCGQVKPMAQAQQTDRPTIWLHDTVEVSEGFVRLKDVAQLHNWDAAAARHWENIPLWPAPTKGQQRFVRARQVQELLVLHGFPADAVEFLGANQIQIVHPNVPESRSLPTTDGAKPSSSVPVIVAKNALRKGHVVSADDVVLQVPSPNARMPSRPLSRIEETVGRELLQAVAAGQVIDGLWLRRPTLVRRGQTVTISSRSGGVVVRLPGRALEDGSLDDLVTVHWLDDRSKQLVARVVGVDSVEVVPVPLTAGR